MKNFLTHQLPLAAGVMTVTFFTWYWSKKSKTQRALASRTQSEQAHLFTRIQAAVEHLQRAPNQIGPEEEALYASIKEIDPRRCTPKLRMVAAQFLQLVLNSHLAHPPVQHGEQEGVSDVNDLQFVWRLLDFVADGRDRAARELLQAEVATRLRDPRKLAFTLDSMIANDSTETTETAVVAFTIAPLLGRWNDTEKLGRQLLKARPDTLEVPTYSSILPSACVCCVCFCTFCSFLFLRMFSFSSRPRSVLSCNVSDATSFGPRGQQGQPVGGFSRLLSFVSHRF